MEKSLLSFDQILMLIAAKLFKIAAQIPSSARRLDQCVKIHLEQIRFPLGNCCKFISCKECLSVPSYLVQARNTSKKAWPFC